MWSVSRRASCCKFSRFLFVPSRVPEPTSWPQTCWRKASDGTSTAWCCLPPPSPSVSARRRRAVWQSDSTQTRISPKHHFTHCESRALQVKKIKMTLLFSNASSLLQRPSSDPHRSSFISLPRLWTEIASFKGKFGQIVEDDAFIPKKMQVRVSQE